MKKIFLPFVALALSTFFYGCSAPAYVEKDNNFNISTAKTYMWVDSRVDQNRESKRATASADIRVHNAVNAELQKRGWTEVTDNPQVLVTYDVLVKRNVETQSDPVYTQPMTRYYYNAYRHRWSSIYYPSQFIGYQEYEAPVKEGTVTITITDADSDRRLWQGWTTERISGAGLGDLNVDKSVRNIFKEG